MSPPIFYAVESDRILVSMRLAPLVSSLVRRPSVCVSRLAAFLATPGELEESWTTSYAGVQRVPAHTTVHVFPDGRRSSALLAHPIVPVEQITAEDAADELRTRLLRVLSRLTRGKRKVAVLAGGGVDSSGVLAATLAVARGASAPEVRAVALHFAGPGDDRPYMRDLVDALGILPLRVSPASGGSLMRRLLVLDGAPHPWPNALFDAALLRAARDEGAEIALSGCGGDDLFTGDVESFAERAWHGDVYRAFREAIKLQVDWQEPGLKQAWQFVARPLPVRPLPHAARRIRRRLRGRKWYPWAGPEFRAYLDRVTNRRTLPEAVSPSARWLRFITSDHLLQVTDVRAQLAAGLGIERVDPLFEDEITEFIFSLPPELLFYTGRTRGLFRLAMAGLVPDSIRWRTDKASFEPAMAEAMSSAGGFDALSDLARMKYSERLGLVNAKIYRESFDALARDPEGRAEEWLNVWPALAVEAFLSGQPEAKC